MQPSYNEPSYSEILVITRIVKFSILSFTFLMQFVSSLNRVSKAIPADITNRSFIESEKLSFEQHSIPVCIQSLRKRWGKTWLLTTSDTLSAGVCCCTQLLVKVASPHHFSAICVSEQMKRKRGCSLRHCKQRPIAA